MDKNITKSTISELLKLIDEQRFIELSNVENLDKYVKKLTTYRFLQLIIFRPILQFNTVEKYYKLVPKQIQKMNCMLIKYQKNLYFP